jgi:plastocyanin
MNITRRGLTTAIFGGASALQPLLARAQPSPSAPVETITVRLSSFSFAPDELRLRVGVPIRLHFVNVSSGGHNFSAPAFFGASIFPSSPPPEDGTVEVAGGSSADVTLIPNLPGTYPFKCTHLLHSMFGMTGTIVVTASQ